MAACSKSTTTPPRLSISRKLRREIVPLAATFFAVLLSSSGLAEDASRRVTVSNAEQLDRAVHMAEPGDHIIISPGRYRAKLRFTAKNSGTKSSPVIVIARDGPKTVVIDGGGTDITIKFNASSYIRLETLDITGGGYHGVFFENGAHDIVVDGNRVHDNHAHRPMNSHAELKGTGGHSRPYRISITNNEIFHTEHPPGGNFQGIDCNLCDDFLIAGNYIHDIREPTSESYSHHDRGSCIQMKSNSRSTVIERNRIARCHIGIAFGGDGPARPAHLGGVVRNNLIHDSTETGIFIVNTAGGEIVHNTLFSNGEAIRIAQDKFQTGGQNHIDILNNILDGPILITGDYRGALKGNYFLQSGMMLRFFKNPSDRNFRLNAGASALIDQAVKTQNEVSRDYGGAPRPQGSGADIGAFEHRPDN